MANEESAEQVTNVDMLATITKSEIDQQIATARAYPRSVKGFLSEARELVTLTEDIAASCIYALPRDGKTIEGPSARFAEVVASCWTNNRAGARVVNEQGEFVTAQGVFHDLERNVAITYEVRRRIVDKNGKRYKPDMIGVTANAACSIALRNAVLKGVPKAFWDTLYQEARRCAMGDVQTLSNRRAGALKLFLGYGITPEQIVATLGVAGVEDIGLDELLTLRGIATAIKDGDTTPEQAFAPPDKPPIKTPQRKTEQSAPAAKAAPDPAPAPDTKPATKKQIEALHSMAESEMDEFDRELAAADAEQTNA